MLAFLLLIACAAPFTGEVGPVVNLWMEAVPGASSQMDQLVDERGYQCLVFQEDGRSFLKSELYGVEGPYDWCWSDPNTIQTDTLEFELELIEEQCWDTRLHLKEYGLDINGQMVPCFRDDLDTGVGLYVLESLPGLRC